MSSIFISPFTDVGSGIKPSDGARLFFFALDVVTPKDTFTTEAATVAHANPVIANSKGVFDEIWIEGSYVAVLKDKNDVQIWQSQPFSSTISNSDLTITKATVAAATADDNLAATAGGFVLIARDDSTNDIDILYEIKLGAGTALGKTVINSDTAGLFHLVRVDSVDVPRPKISFIFDDGWASVLGDLKTLFDARGYKFAAAVPLGSLGNPGRLVLADIPDILTSGFEVLNHAFSGDSPATTSYGLCKFRGEVQSNWSELNAIGVNPVGFVTPSSVLNTIYRDELSKVCSYGFTKDASTVPILKGEDPFNLARFTMEAFTLEQCVDAVDAVYDTKTTIVFYAHDIVTDDVNYDKIVAIIDRAEVLGIDIVSVTESIKAVTDISPQPQPWHQGELLANDPNEFDASGDATQVVGNVSDITVTAVTAANVLVQATFDLPDSITNGELLTFSSVLRNISGTFGTANSIGIQLKDVGDVVLDSEEISTITLNTNDTRYNVSIVHFGAAVKATVFMRIDATVNGSVALMRNPVLRLGTSVNPQKFFTLPAMAVTTNLIPTQTVTAGSAQTLTLTDGADNGRFLIASNNLTITSDFIGSIHGTVSGAEQATSGGYVAWVMGGGSGGSVAISPISASSGITVGCSVMAGQFVTGQSFTMQVQADTVNLSLVTGLSRITSM